MLFAGADAPKCLVDCAPLRNICLLREGKHDIVCIKRARYVRYVIILKTDYEDRNNPGRSIISFFNYFLFLYARARARVK